MTKCPLSNLGAKINQKPNKVIETHVFKNGTKDLSYQYQESYHYTKYSCCGLHIQLCTERIIINSFTLFELHINH